MGTYSGEYKRVNGSKYFICVSNGVLFRRVLIRDGNYKHSNNTLESSTVLKMRGMGVEEQVARTLDRVVQRQESIDRAADQLDEVYGSDW